MNFEKQKIDSHWSGMGYKFILMIVNTKQKKNIPIRNENFATKFS